MGWGVSMTHPFRCTGVLACSAPARSAVTVVIPSGATPAKMRRCGGPLLRHWRTTATPRCLAERVGAQVPVAPAGPWVP